MQPTRMMAMQPTRMMAMRQSPQLFMRQTMALRNPVPVRSPEILEMADGLLTKRRRRSMAVSQSQRPSLRRTTWIDDIQPTPCPSASAS